MLAQEHSLNGASLRILSILIPSSQQALVEKHASRVAAIRITTRRPQQKRRAKTMMMTKQRRKRPGKLKKRKPLELQKKKMIQ
jgi:hypothetical protein